MKDKDTFIRNLDKVQTPKNGRYSLYSDEIQAIVEDARRHGAEFPFYVAERAFMLGFRRGTAYGKRGEKR